MFQQFDADRDGALTKDEVPGPAWERLSAADADEDGIVTQAEAAASDQMRRFSRQHGVIEELVHDVFVEAFVILKSYRSRGPFLHWLRKIAVRTGYRYWKRRSREQSTFQSLSEIHDGLEQLVDGVEPSPIWASEMLGDLLDRLGPRDRLVLTLLYWDGCSVAEAAELAGWSQTIVKVQAYRARQRLKRLIEEARR